MSPSQDDEFRSKGAVEQDRPGQQTNTTMTGQMGHRNKGPIVGTNDTDFPEPGQSPEHSGELMQKDTAQNGDREKLEPEADEIQDEVNPEPGDRQRRNQNEEESDPLAA